MNQKDYKAVAKIIKESQHKGQINRSLIAQNLADYIEKQDKSADRKHTNWINAKIPDNMTYVEYVKSNFNRQQFLDDCGCN